MTNTLAIMTTIQKTRVTENIDKHQIKPSAVTATARPQGHHGIEAD